MHSQRQISSCEQVFELMRMIFYLVYPLVWVEADVVADGKEDASVPVDQDQDQQDHLGQIFEKILADERRFWSLNKKSYWEKWRKFFFFS